MSAWNIGLLWVPPLFWDILDQLSIKQFNNNVSFIIMDHCTVLKIALTWHNLHFILIIHKIHKITYAWQKTIHSGLLFIFSMSIRLFLQGHFARVLGHKSFKSCIKLPLAHWNDKVSVIVMNKNSTHWVGLLITVYARPNYYNSIWTLMLYTTLNSYPFKVVFFEPMSIAVFLNPNCSLLRTGKIAISSLRIGKIIQIAY